MEFNSASFILFIILSCTLIVFLIVLTLVLLYVFKVVRNVKRITSATERVVDSAEAVGEAFRRTSGPVAFMRLVYGIVDKASHTGSKSKRGDK